MLVVEILSATALLWTSPRPHSPSAATQPQECVSRRALLLGGLGAGLGSAWRWPAAAGDVSSMILQYDATGKLVSAYDEETAFRDLRGGSASVRILANWEQGNDGSLLDPVQGPAASSLRFSARETQLKAISDLGRAEQALPAPSGHLRRAPSRQLMPSHATSALLPALVPPSPPPTLRPLPRSPGESPGNVGLSHTMHTACGFALWVARAQCGRGSLEVGQLSTAQLASILSALSAFSW